MQPSVLVVADGCLLLLLDRQFGPAALVASCSCSHICSMMTPSDVVRTSTMQVVSRELYKMPTRDPARTFVSV